MSAREQEADEFYAELDRPAASTEESRILRQAFAGMLWCKQYYAYDVPRWIDGDPGMPPPPAERRGGRNTRWRNMDAADIMSMPDSWEYPWFAAWDLAFHTVTLANVDPAFAKYQLLLLCREWFQHPSGALPAYEWSFDDVNPPVHAWAALRVFWIDGGTDTEFLERIFHKLLMNFTWWLNQEDAGGDDIFGGGFLGLDNIGAFDRSHVPAGSSLEQSDATAWMAFYSISMLRIAYVLADRDPTYKDLLVTFLEHTVRIARAMDEHGLWNEENGFYFDALRTADGSTIPMEVHSMVGIIPLLPAAFVPEDTVRHSLALGKHFARFLAGHGLSRDSFERSGSIQSRPDAPTRLLSLVSTERLQRILGELLSEDEFLSPHGLRALSLRHRDRPFVVTIDGSEHSVDYEPGESRSGLFGGNSNWRGPVWFPLNYLVIESLVHWDDWFGDELRIEHPTDRATSCASRMWLATWRSEWSASGYPAPTVGVLSTATTGSWATTPNGAIYCHSTSTSTATPALAWAPRIRPAGPASWPTCSCAEACLMIDDPGAGRGLRGRLGHHAGSGRLGIVGCSRIVIVRIVIVAPVDASRVAAIEDLGAARLAEVVPAPFDEGIDAIAEARHQGRVDTEPGSEGDGAVQLVVAERDLSDGRVAADHGHAALVEIVERLGCRPIDLGDDVLARPGAALHGHGTELRVCASIRTRDVGHVPGNVDAGEACDRQIRLDVDATTAAGGQTRVGRERCGLQASAPDDAASLDGGPIGEAHVARPDLGDSGPKMQAHAVLLQDLGRIVPGLLGEHLEQRVAVVHEVDLCTPHSDIAVLGSERAVDHLGERTRDLHAGGTSADHHELHGTLIDQAGVSVGFLEQLEDASAQSHRVVDRVQGKGVLIRAGRVEEVGL